MNNTVTRALSGIVYVALLLIATLHSSDSLMILFGVFLLIATIEFCKLIHINYVLPAIITVSIYTLFNLNQTNKTNDILLLSATLFVSLKAILFLFDNKNRPIDKISKYIYVIGYIALPFIIITKIPFGIKGYNPKILISIFILIWTNDTFAFLVGKSIGKNKLFEKVSPKKTIEGFVGGLLFCLLGSFIIAKYYIEAVSLKSIYIWLIIALIVSVFGTIGDLIESKFKRIAEVKDSGNIMPGHGGILDRLDSVIFVAPFVFLFYQILYYVS